MPLPQAEKPRPQHTAQRHIDFLYPVNGVDSYQSLQPN